MNDERAFLNAITADPKDDTPRLVFADWLQERGEDDRAEFIRVQCERARLPEGEPRRYDLIARERALLETHAEEWFGGADPGRSHGDRWFHHPDRGFIGGVTVYPDAVADAEFDALFGSHPIHRCVVTRRDYQGLASGREWTPRFLEFPYLDRLSGLSFSERVPPGDQRRLCRDPRLRLLLTFLADPIGWPEMLRQERAFPRLRSLSFHVGFALDGPREGADFPERATEVFDADHWPDLREFSSSGVNLRGDTLADAADRPLLQRLTRLSLTLNRSLHEGFERFDQISHAGRLESLNLDGTELGVRGRLALVQSPFFANLRHLTVCQDTPLRLTRAPFWPKLESLKVKFATRDQPFFSAFQSAEPNNLRKLGFPYCALPNAELLKPLCEWPGLAGVRVLDLEYARIDNRSLGAVLRSPHLRSLVKLDIAAHQDNERGFASTRANSRVKDLAESGLLGRLLDLSIGTGDVTVEGWRTLFASAEIGGLRRLRLHEIRLDEPVAKLIAESPHLDNLVELQLKLPYNDSYDQGIRLLSDRFGHRLRDRFGRVIKPGETA